MSSTPPPSNPSHPAWRVMKFGGSSVADGDNWARIGAEASNVLAGGGNAVVVVSAIAGITDLLEGCLQAPADFDPDATLAEVRRRHAVLAASVDADAGVLAPLFEQLHAALERVHAAGPEREPGPWAEVLAFGELLSSRLGEHILCGQGLDCQWLDSRELLVTTDNPRRSQRASRLSAECDTRPSPEMQQRLARRGRLFIAPGFIARDPAGNTALLGRGGSDISAALIGTLLDADRVEIFSDVPGLFSADPRRTPAARLLRAISYREALELAAMGARALHPRALLPLKKHRIPLWLRQTARPEIEGTKITPEAHEHGAQVKAIVARKNITLVALEGIDMWQQVGFMADIFGVFRDHGLSVDLVSTSESNVTLTLDPGANLADDATLDRLAADLGRFAQVDINTDCATVSLVGLGIRTILHRLGPALEVFEQRRIFQVSQAANDLNLTFVVEARHADRLVQQLHQQIIPGGVGGDAVFGPSWEALFRRAEEAEATPAWWRIRRERLIETLQGRDTAYVYDLASIQDAARRMVELPAVDRVLYSMKANPHADILRTACANGLGIECVSLAEARHALASVDGLRPADLLFTPNFGPRAEYIEALEMGLQVTIDNPWILEHWGADFAGQSVFLRLDPGSGLGHHKMVRTAGSNAKFGVPLGELERVAKLARAHDVSITGLHAHTGSGIMHPDNWHRTLETLGEAARELPDVEVIDLGGGLGVPDRETDLPLDLAALEAGIAGLKTRLVRPVKIWLEPGRFLVSQAGVLVARVTQVKGKGDMRYVGIATGMNSLIRPALYGAWHEIVNLTRLDQPGDQVYNVVGPICETGDILGLDRLLPECREGDLILIANTGAYGAAMASRYNLRDPAEELVLPCDR
ncbi:MAG: bifunctional aspartate kinase/diaminopimelate decarboxylase [Wenzhouxiangellaceae bacterium]|nr:bifunctional aspartate kinase/diaminopimelate decarboxylase [Wenzhouxiangellaceae bacterium]